MTEEVRAAVEQRVRTADLSEAVAAIAAAENVPKAQIYRKAVREFVARWNASRTPPEPPKPTRSGVFPA